MERKKKKGEEQNRLHVLSRITLFPLVFDSFFSVFFWCPLPRAPNAPRVQRDVKMGIDDVKRVRGPPVQLMSN